MIKSEIAAPARAEQPGKLSPWWRKLLLTVHLALSVGVIGADLSMITLGITGLMSGSAELIRVSYLVMEVLADSILLPLAFSALLTGILLALGTPWGLARYYWVLTKFVLTIAAVTALVFVLILCISQAAANVLQVSLADLAANGIGQVGVVVTAGPTGALLVLLTATILAVYKPWGQIRLIRHDPAPQQRTASNDL